MKKISLHEKIFVAGSRGMAGSAICRALKKHGYGTNTNRGELLTPVRQELNLLDSNALNNWFLKNKPTVVVLAAGKVGGILANSNSPTEFLLENIKIQTNVIETSWRFGVKRLLFLGSSCIYPKFAHQPISEDSLLSGPLELTNQWYAIAKITGIKLCKSLRTQYGFDAISLMPTNLYGPGDNYHPTNSHVMASLIKKFCEASFYSIKSVNCWGSGTPLREFLHVDDLGEAVVFALENWDPSSKNAPLDNSGVPLDFLNVGSGKDISIKDLSKKIAQFSGFDGEVVWDSTKPDGTPKKQLDCKRINNLGWNAQINLDEGLKETVLNYMAKLKQTLE
ncbi:MAG: GDP-L-fucose synthase [Prochlorococcus marinus XMU1429]|nr:GDP-L-fucose synthase [Prochlorococcus marinus XMU1429]